MSDEMAVIAARCRAEGGLTKATLGELREQLGYGKLGKWVLVEVAEAIKNAGLGYFPLTPLDPKHNETPRKEQSVWIFDASEGDLRCQVIEIILDPRDYLDEDVRSILNGVAGGDSEALTAEQKLERIREIVSADTPGGE